MHTLNSHGLTALYSLGRGPEGEDYVLSDVQREAYCPYAFGTL